MDDKLVIVCKHILNGQKVYHRTQWHVICKECFKHFNTYGHNKYGYWNIPENEDLSNLRTVCRLCINQLIKHRNEI